MQPFTGASSRALLTTAAVAVTGLLTAASGLAYAWLFLRGPVWGNRSPS